jgi:putative FmdB family regulatory protein
MPIYEYVCGDCKHELEKIQKIIDTSLKECPSCKKLNLQKRVSSGGFILKGVGFHKPGHSSR